MRTVLPDYSDEIHKIILFSLSADARPEVSIPGPIILSRLLPYHLSSPQTFLLIIGLLLGTPVTEVIHWQSREVTGGGFIKSVTEK